MIPLRAQMLWSVDVPAARRFAERFVERASGAVDRWLVTVTNRVVGKTTGWWDDPLMWPEEWADHIEDLVDAAVGFGYTTSWMTADTVAFVDFDPLLYQWPEAKERLRVDPTHKGLRAMLDAAGIKVKSIAENRLALVSAVLEDAITGVGASWEQVADRIRDLMLDPGRAEMVAITEMARAMNTATVDWAEAHGIDMGMVLTARDERTCQVCVEAEESGWQPFASLPAVPLHPRCRCTIILELDTAPQARGSDFPSYPPARYVAGGRGSAPRALPAAAWEAALAGKALKPGGHRKLQDYDPATGRYTSQGGMRHSDLERWKNRLLSEAAARLKERGFVRSGHQRWSTDLQVLAALEIAESVDLPDGLADMVVTDDDARQRTLGDFARSFDEEGAAFLGSLNPKAVGVLGVVAMWGLGGSEHEFMRHVSIPGDPIGVVFEAFRERSARLAPEGKVKVWRGLGDRELSVLTDEIPAWPNPVAWTSRLVTAQVFGAHGPGVDVTVLEAEVPFKDVTVGWWAGFGVVGEEEMLIAGDRFVGEQVDYVAFSDRRDVEERREPVSIVAKASKPAGKDRHPQEYDPATGRYTSSQGISTTSSREHWDADDFHEWLSGLEHEARSWLNDHGLDADRLSRDRLWKSWVTGRLVERLLANPEVRRLLADGDGLRAEEREPSARSWEMMSSLRFGADAPPEMVDRLLRRTYEVLKQWQKHTPGCVLNAVVDGERGERVWRERFENGELDRWAREAPPVDVLDRLLAEEMHRFHQEITPDVTVDLFRGVSEGRSFRRGTVKLTPGSAWSVYEGVPWMFGSVRLVLRDVPLRDVWCAFWSGVGCAREGEVTVPASLAARLGPETHGARHGHRVRDGERVRVKATKPGGGGQPQEYDPGTGRYAPTRLDPVADARSRATPGNKFGAEPGSLIRNPHATWLSKLSDVLRAKVVDRVSNGSCRGGGTVGEKVNEMVKREGIVYHQNPFDPSSPVVERDWRNPEDARLMALENASRLFGEATPDEIEYGLGWYREAQQIGFEVAETAGVDGDTGLGALAILSRSTEWDQNVAWARYAAAMVAEQDRLLIPDDVRSELGLPDDAIVMADLGSADFARVMARLSPNVRLENGYKLQLSMGLGADKKYPEGLTAAVALLRGEEPLDLVVSGHKVRSFFNCLSDPDNLSGADDVTVDTHAWSVLFGGRVTSDSPVLKSVANSPESVEENVQGAYAWAADIYREIASELSRRTGRSWTPSAAQAVLWVVWRNRLKERPLLSAKNSDKKAGGDLEADAA